jgi:hypothetical protein
MSDSQFLTHRETALLCGVATISATGFAFVVSGQITTALVVSTIGLIALFLYDRSKTTF